MKKISRRQFLSFLSKSAVAAAVMQLLQACGFQPAESPAPPVTPSNTPFRPPELEPTNTVTVIQATAEAATPLPTESPSPTAAPPTAYPEPAYLAVARGGNDPGALARRAVEAIGGMDRFVFPGAKVLIKPNVCTSNYGYEYAATTNPWVVGELVRMCIETGAARVLVFDFPFNGSNPQNYYNSGIADQVLAAGGELETINYDKFIPTTLPNPRSLQSAAFYSEVIDADAVINVPIAKYHTSAVFTLGMKNMMGVVADRGAVHSAGLQQSIADLANFVRPELTVIDAVRILIRNGPISNNANDVRILNTVIASADIVAADAYAAGRIFSAYYPQYSDPNGLGYVRIGAEIGLGRSDLDNLQIEEFTVG
jgi:uncharacterized protein (DUF362 family)